MNTSEHCERTPYVFVVAKPHQDPRLFRNYDTVNPIGRQDVKIWEAARAISAVRKQDCAKSTVETPCIIL